MLFQKYNWVPDKLKSDVGAPDSDFTGQRDPVTFPVNRVNRFIRRLSIVKKIGYGYSLAIGIAVLGTTIGMAIGDYYQKEAEDQLRFADEQQHLLSELEKAVVAVRSHPHRLVSVLGKSILFECESSKFLGEVAVFQKRLDALESFAEIHSMDLAADATEFKQLLQGYKTNTELYTQLIQELWQQLDPGSLKQEEIPAARQQVFVAISGERAIKIDFYYERLTESLNRLAAAAQTQQGEADARLNRASALRLQLIVASMLLSVAIAVALAFYTSCAIARPVESVTQVAQRVTREGNFTLQAPVTTEDEVALLANSLNQLVLWVGEHTQNLELARQTLEQRVEERTLELTRTLQELKQTQAQLIQTEKMSSLGQVVAGVAHEINNPVNFIHGNIKYLRDYTQELLAIIRLYQQRCTTFDPEIQDRLEDIDLEFVAEDLPKVLSSMKMGTERIRQIVLSLRNFSRLDEAEMKAVDIHEGIDSTLLILNHRLKQGIEVIKQYGDLPKIACYPAGLNQVFMNILANAIDALEEGQNAGRPAPTPAPAIVIQTGRVDSGHIRVGIRDSGPGIPPEIMGKLFDPFFTTKPVGSGTGLGLSICYQIVEKHRGKIEVSSPTGQGAEFAVLLPVD
ncbi:sensor histidine kinase [Kamptonema formosum]|uniref:sensor histidine kinase n=1 Tax=Kamptonema formosum TaxID=331992 RepID=UPI00034CE67C|nr:ATP-binding protein [Oscillatoria sp. PCC 10802]